jgi:serine/threonine protein kinase
MGVVYHAVDRELKENVAIKIVRADLVAENATFVERLKSEIRLARKLSHANILRAHDLGEFGGTYFITMEYVNGVSVQEMLDQRGVISPDATVALGIQLADALAAAHAEQIVHRDIKPANLLMDERGTLKVLDFGVAKVIAGEPGLTMQGVAVGTPQYMAPEQLMGGALDARADLFAVGVVLYECLTGRPPFLADSAVALVEQMLDCEYPRLTDIAADVPPRLAAVIDSLLQPKPEARVQTAADLSRRLGDIEPSNALEDAQ